MSPAATGRIFRHVRQRRRRAGNRRCQRAVERSARHRVSGGIEIHVLRRRERCALARVHHRFEDPSDSRCSNQNPPPPRPEPWGSTTASAAPRRPRHRKRCRRAQEFHGRRRWPADARWRWRRREDATARPMQQAPIGTTTGSAARNFMEGAYRSAARLQKNQAAVAALVLSVRNSDQAGWVSA